MVYVTPPNLKPIFAETIFNLKSWFAIISIKSISSSVNQTRRLYFTIHKRIDKIYKILINKWVSLVEQIIKKKHTAFIMSYNILYISRGFTCKLNYNMKTNILKIFFLFWRIQLGSSLRHRSASGARLAQKRNPAVHQGCTADYPGAQGNWAMRLLKKGSPYHMEGPRYQNIWDIE